MDRREALKQVAWLMGGAISAAAVLGLLQGCSSKQAPLSWKPLFFNDEQAKFVTEVAEIIIPRTQTPGALDVGVPAFIDVMLKEAYPQDERERYLSGLKAFDEEAQRLQGKPFMQLPAEQRAAFVKTVHDAAVAAEREVDRRPGELQRPFILMTKELTLLGFFTSQVGATQVLQYVAIPGHYHGCVPVAEAGNGKSWAGEQSRRF